MQVVEVIGLVGQVLLLTRLAYVWLEVVLWAKSDADGSVWRLTTRNGSLLGPILCSPTGSLGWAYSGAGAHLASCDREVSWRAFLFGFWLGSGLSVMSGSIPERADSGFECWF